MKNIPFDLIVSARTDSSRLPNKALLPLLGMPLVLFLLHRIEKSKFVRNMILATTDRAVDDELANLVSAAGFRVFRGNTNDLIDRHINAAQAFGFDGNLIRVTGDCPLVSAESLDYCIEQVRGADEPFDLATTKGEFPIGIDYEIFSLRSLKKIFSQPDLNAMDREHLTLYYYNHATNFHLLKLNPMNTWRFDQRVLTVDTPEDYQFVKKIVDSIGSVDFSMEQLISFLGK